MKKLFILSVLVTHVFSGDMVITSKDDFWTELQLNGKDEFCSISISKHIRHGSRITVVNCEFLTNSKNVDIICTKRKTICKTEKEIIHYADSSHFISPEKKPEKKKNEKKDNNQCGLFYHQYAAAKTKCNLDISLGRINDFNIWASLKTHPKPYKR